MRYLFEGSGRVVSTGSFAVNALNFPGLPVPSGTRLAFRWAGRTVEVVAKTNPIEVNEIPAGDGGEAYVANLTSFFREYFPFREDFTVSLDSINGAHSIVFEAKRPGPVYNFTPVDALPNVARIEARFVGSEPVLRPRYSIYVELHLQKRGTTGASLSDYQRIYPTSIETNADGLAEFDAGDLLHAALSADWPAWNSPAAQPSPESARSYYISFGEAWGNPLQVGRINNDALRYAYLGGADFVRRSGAGFDLLRLAAGISQTEDKALRLGPSTRYVRIDEPQFLTFFNSRETAQAALRIRLTFDNGSGLTLTDAVPAFAFATGEKWTLPVGVAQLDLLSRLPAGRTLREYSVRLSTAGSDPDGNAHLSIDYRYVLNYTYEPHVRFFAFLSSLGAVETLTSFGKGSSELNRFYEQAERVLPAQYSLNDGQFVEYDVSVQKNFEVSTGFRTQDDLLYWTDFYRTAARFELTRTATTYQVLPIGILSKSIKQAKDGDTLFAHKFAYIYLFRDDFFSVPDALAGDAVPPPTFTPGGAVTITQPTVVDSIDRTVPDIVRTLTVDDIKKFRIAAARPNPETLGFLSQPVADALYFRQDQKIDYQRDITGKPTTRDQAGLLDVPTAKEALSASLKLISRTVRIRSRLASWTTATEPQHK